VPLTPDRIVDAIVAAETAREGTPA